MAKGFSKKQKLVMIGSVFVVLLVIFTLPDNPFTSADGFKISLPADLAPAGTDGVAITCKVKQTTEIKDTRNRVIETKQSTLIEGSPEFLQLTSQSGKDIGSFHIFPKIFCTHEGKVKYPITVDSARLQLRVFSEGLDNIKRITEIETISTKQLKFASGDGEQTLGEFRVDAENVDKKLASSSGSFDSFQEFRVAGNLIVYFTNFDSIKYTIPIEQTDIRTFYLLEVSGNGKDNNNITCPDGTKVEHTDQCIVPEDVKPTNEEICESSGGTWETASGLGIGGGICRSGNVPDRTNIGDSELVINLEVLYRDNKKQQTLIDKDFTTTFSQATLLGSLDNNERTLSKITYNPFLKLDSGDRTVSFESQNLKVKPVLRVAGQDIELTDRLLSGAAKTAASVQFGTFTGFSLGEASVSSAEIHQAISENLVPVGQQRTVLLTVEIEGDLMIKKDGEILTENIQDVKIDWDGLKLTRETVPITGGGASGSLNCESGGKVLGIVDGVETCVEKGDGDGDGETGQDNICVDAVNTGGFFCDEDYRNTYCSGTTTCQVPPTSTGGTTDDCPDDGLQSASLADECLTVTVSGDDDSFVDQPTCENCDLGTGNDNMLLIIGLSVAIVGIIVYSVKRRG